MKINGDNDVTRLRALRESLPKLSVEMQKKLLSRLDALPRPQPVMLVGEDLRAATVEDAERLVLRFSTWSNVFSELESESVLEEDRAAFLKCREILGELLADLERAIRATREGGAPWSREMEP